LQTRNFQQHIKIFLQLSLLYITRPDYCFDQRNNFDLFWCNHLCSEDMFKCNDLFRGQLPVTKEQLEPVLFDPTNLYSEDNLILGRGRWNYLFLDLGQTKAYKVKPGVFGVHIYERPPHCIWKWPLNRGGCIRTSQIVPLSKQLSGLVMYSRDNCMNILICRWKFLVCKSIWICPIF
jgi:hypothetical protein